MKLLITMFILSTLLLGSIGNITSFKGSVSIERDTKKILSKVNLPIEQNDIISTRKDSNVIIKFNDNTIITIGKDSILNIQEYLYDDKVASNSKTQFNFLKGTFKSVTGTIGHLNPNKFKLNTKTAGIGIRGTVMLGNQNIIACTKGAISVKTNAVSVSVQEGEYVDISKTTVSTPKKLTIEILSLLNNALGVSTKSTIDNENKSTLQVVSKMLEKDTASQNSRDSGTDGDSGNGGGGHDH